MSWDVTLLDDRGHTEGDWNYTHNTNAMIADALRASTGIETPDADGPLGPVVGAAWWKKLHGAGGVEGRDYLAAIITGLEADPDHYRDMNPDNGWGDYDSLIGVLREMRDRLPEWPCRWEANG